MWRYILLLFLLAFSATAIALQPKHIQHIVIFGDSLSDDGYADLTPRPAGKSATYSNGNIWAEYLTTMLLHQQALANNLHPLINGPNAYASGTLNGFDYAAGGATTAGSGISFAPANYQPPSVTQQIDNYLQQHQNTQGKISADNLYIIWVGANDLMLNYIHHKNNPFKMLIDFFPTSDTVVTNITQQVNRLHQFGARHIIVIDVPDIGLTPLLSHSWSGRMMYHFFINRLNNHLQQTLNTEKLGFYVKIIEVNNILRNIIQSQGKDIAINGKVFNFTNVTESAVETNPKDERRPLSIYSLIKPGTEHYLFSDALHPTSYGHQLIALDFEQQILADNNL